VAYLFLVRRVNKSDRGVACGRIRIRAGLIGVGDL
jgi:hypothetical protein